jgi:hypothetical protein
MPQPEEAQRLIEEHIATLGEQKAHMPRVERAAAKSSPI